MVRFHTYGFPNSILLECICEIAMKAVSFLQAYAIRQSLGACPRPGETGKIVSVCPKTPFIPRFPASVSAVPSCPPADPMPRSCGLIALSGRRIAARGLEFAPPGDIGARAAVPAPGGVCATSGSCGRQAARGRCVLWRFLRRRSRPMRWTFRATTESATARAKPPAPWARTRSRPRCPRLLIADSTAGCCWRTPAKSSSLSHCASDGAP